MTRTLTRALIVLFAGAALAACRAVTCEPREFTPTGELAVDLLGSWDWSAEGWFLTSDKWAYTFHADGGLTITHSWYQRAGAIAYDPESATQAYVVADGGFTQLGATPPLSISTTFVPGAMVQLPPFPGLPALTHQALTCDPPL